MSEGRDGAGDASSTEAFGPFADLIEGIDALTRRRRGHWRQPIICLVGPDGASAGLEMLADSLKVAAARQVPYAIVDTAASTDVRDTLAQLAEQLAIGHFSRDQLRFRHFWFIDWLMNQKLPPGSANERQTELARRLRRASGPRSYAGQTSANVLSGWSGLALWLIATVVPAIVFRVLVNGRLPGTGRVFRWFMGQEYRPKQAIGFWAFALRLTDNGRSYHDQNELRNLLVNAFLQDLRVQFRRRPWRLSAWRRTACPMALLDHAAPDNSGFQLLRLVCTVRSETGQSDPLLVVAATKHIPPDGAELSNPDGASRAVPLNGVRHPLLRWRSFSSRRVLRTADCYLAVAMPVVTGLRQLSGELPRIIPPRSPWLARRAVLAVLLLLPFLTVIGWAGKQWYRDCFPIGFGGRVKVIYDAGECVGYSDHTSYLFGTDKEVRDIQRRIFEANEEAERSWSNNMTDRPNVTLVYFGTLTKPGDPRGGELNAETFVAEREELEGMATAQYRANLEARNDSNKPFVRILVANAGDEMRSAKPVAEMLNKLLEDDPSILGILGLVESRTWTQDALKELNQTDLPVVAPTLSADGIGKVSNSYLQIAPPNIDQAKLVLDYTTTVLKKQRIRNYRTYGSGGKRNAETDLYVRTLADDLRTKFEEAGLKYEEDDWDGQQVHDACSDKFDGVVFFGGRYSNFAAFLDKLYQDCNQQLPALLGDDSVNRYMANSTTRQTAPSNFPLAYVSKGSLAFCANLHMAEDAERKNFLADLKTFLNRCGDDNVPVGERVGLAYDAVRLPLQAIQDAAVQRPNGGVGERWNPNDVSPGQLYNAVRLSTRIGVTGKLQFDQNGIAKDKYLTLLCAPNIMEAFRTDEQVPHVVFSQGTGHDKEPMSAQSTCQAQSQS